MGNSAIEKQFKTKAIHSLVPNGVYHADADGNILASGGAVNGQFGNGCTVNATKIISEGTSILLTYVVFPEGTTLTSDQLSTLKTICETMVSK